MHNTLRMWRFALAVSCLVLLVPAIVQAEETPAAPAATATPVTAAPAAATATPPAATATPAAAESLDDIQKHAAAGEVKFGGKWMPIMDLFEMYRKTIAEVKAVADKGAGGKDRLTELNKTLAQILGDWRKEKQPVENEKRAALQKKARAEQILGTNPPPPPKLLPVPTGGGGGWGGFAGGYGGNRNNNNNYNQNEVNRVNQENQRRQEAYQRLMAQYNDGRQQATVALEETKAKIAECDKKLEEFALARKTKEKPFLEERVKLNEQLRSSPTAAASKVHQADGMEAALRASPFPLRNSKGIVEWRTDFYLLADLEEMYKKVKGEIDDARREAEAKARLDGKELPKDWRHPKHEEAESLNEAITRGKAGMPATK
jgi:hypothetical protein